MTDDLSSNFSAGLGGFLAFFLLAIALWLLMRNMSTRMRRMAYRDRHAERPEEEAPGEATPGEAAPDEADTNEAEADGAVLDEADPDEADPEATDPDGPASGRDDGR